MLLGVFEDGPGSTDEKMINYSRSPGESIDDFLETLSCLK